MKKARNTLTTFPNHQQSVGSSLCGPMCVVNIMEHLGKKISVQSILSDLHKTEEDFTFLPELARYLLQQKVETQLITSNPYQVEYSWKELSKTELIDKLKAWLALHQDNDWRTDTLHLLWYLQEGGKVEITNLTTELIDTQLNQGKVILTSLNATWIWEKRKVEDKAEYDDLKGMEVIGHLVVIYQHDENHYWLSDPYPTGLKEKDGIYTVDKAQVLNSILTRNPQILVI